MRERERERYPPPPPISFCSSFKWKTEQRKTEKRSAFKSLTSWPFLYMTMSHKLSALSGPLFALLHMPHDRASVESSSQCGAVQLLVWKDFLYNPSDDCNLRVDNCGCAPRHDNAECFWLPRFNEVSHWGFIEHSPTSALAPFHFLRGLSFSLSLLNTPLGSRSVCS